MRRLWIFSLLCVIFLARTGNVQAAMSISSTAIVPAQVIDTLSNTITVTVSSTSGGLAYIRPVFYKAGTTTPKYFGCATSEMTPTYCGSSLTGYPSITGAGAVTLSVRADTSDPLKFLGSGEYKFKVFRCTPSSTSLSSCTEAKFVGTDSTEQTVEITQTIADPTPSPTQNSTAAPTTSATTQTTNDATPTPSPTAIPVQPTGVILSELMVCPSAGTNEWIELANTNSHTVTIKGWELRDSTTKNHILLPEQTIQPQGFLVVEVVSDSGGPYSMYNNSGDTVKLLDATGSTVESFSYTSCSSDQSWSKQGGTWSQTSQISKGDANQFPSASPTSTPVGVVIAKTTSKSSPIPTATISVTPTAMDAAMNDNVLGVASDESQFDAEAASTSARAQFDGLSPRTKIMALGTLAVGGTTLVGLGRYLLFQFLKKKRK